MVLIRSILVLGIAGIILACSGEAAQEEEMTGQEIYQLNCVTCHGPQGDLSFAGATDLTQSEMPLADRITIISNGKGAMLPHKDVLSEEHIRAVAEYSLTLKK